MHFLNIHHSIESVGRLVRAIAGGVPDLENLDAAYRKTITRLRPVEPPPTSISISYEDGRWGRYLVENRVFEDIFVGIRPCGPETRTTWTAQIRSAVNYIGELQPNLGRLVDLLVTDAVLFDSDRVGGGSASHLPGLICISPAPGWGITDFAETIVHEATHLNLFVLDMVYGIYGLPTRELEAPEHRVLSAVKIGQMRPLDKAFHSAAVAVPLMCMQYLRGESTLIDLFGKSLAECSGGLMAKRHAFTEYGVMLVEELDAFSRSIDFNEVLRSRSSPEFGAYQIRSA